MYLLFIFYQMKLICFIQESENVGLRTEHEKKDNELANALTLLKEVEAENKKLLLEVETPQAREKLLAAIESDKVAAAKAVSQNQKLKNQIMELEEAFVKIVRNVE